MENKKNGKKEEKKIVESLINFAENQKIYNSAELSAIFFPTLYSL